MKLINTLFQRYGNLSRFVLAMLIAIVMLSYKGFENITYIPLSVYLVCTIVFGSFLLIAGKYRVLPGPTGSLRKEKSLLFYYSGITVVLAVLLFVNLYFVISLVQ